MSSPETNRRDDHDDDGINCGHKFRTMLKCVERTGDVSACTHQINTFLACERAVFRTALRTDPRRVSSAPFTSQPHSQSPPPPPNHPDPHSQAPALVPPSPPFSTWFPEMFRRAVDKQAHACVEVLRTFGQSDSPMRVIDVCQRIVGDVAYSCKLLSQKALSVAKDVVNRGKDETNKP